MYSDNLPDGVDIIFNTNKHNTVSKMDAMKSMKEDPDNPFGATVRQKHYIDADGNKIQRVRKISPPLKVEICLLTSSPLNKNIANTFLTSV